ncbi:MAG: hypothetical protein QOJ29_1850 [Thermoleophilaceae bacterium]|jgi:hypothetical protein|nr:hypothetical protein [Thermoleophilaceae bacterium]
MQLQPAIHQAVTPALTLSGLTVAGMPIALTVVLAVVWAIAIRGPTVGRDWLSFLRDLHDYRDERRPS